MMAESRYLHPITPDLISRTVLLQGFKCINCKLMVHKKCHKAIRLQCDRKNDVGGYDNQALNGNTIPEEGLDLRLARTGTGSRAQRRHLVHGDDDISSEDPINVRYQLPLVLILLSYSGGKFLTESHFPTGCLSDGAGWSPRSILVE